MIESTPTLDEVILDLRAAVISRLAHLRNWHVSAEELRDLVGSHTDDEIIARLGARPPAQPPGEEAVVAAAEPVPDTRWRFWRRWRRPWVRRPQASTGRE